MSRLKIRVYLLRRSETARRENPSLGQVGAATTNIVRRQYRRSQIPDAARHGKVGIKSSSKKRSNVHTRVNEATLQKGYPYGCLFTLGVKRFSTDDGASVELSFTSETSPFLRMLGIRA